MSLLMEAKEQLNRVLDLCVIVLLAALAGVLFVAVITRYFFNFPLAWSEEVSRYAFVWVSFLGAELCLRINIHAAVDLLVKTLPPRVQRVVWRIGQTLVAIFLIGLLISGIHITRVAHDQLSPALGIPMSFVYSAVPVGAALMLLELLIQLRHDPSAVSS
jgi:TRAP-type C4-dicarboxylate transport system permease small subunit